MDDESFPSPSRHAFQAFLRVRKANNSRSHLIPGAREAGVSKDVANVVSATCDCPARKGGGIQTGVPTH